MTRTVLSSYDPFSIQDTTGAVFPTQVLYIDVCILQGGILCMVVVPFGMCSNFHPYMAQLFHTYMIWEIYRAGKDNCFHCIFVFRYVLKNGIFNKNILLLFHFCLKSQIATVTNFMAMKFRFTIINSNLLKQTLNWHLPVNNHIYLYFFKLVFF